MTRKNCAPASVAVMDAVPFLTVLRARRTSSVIVAGNQWKAAENEEISQAKHFAYLFGIGRLYSKHLSPFWAREKLKRNKVETGL
jgi:hypothetical protein